MSHKILIIEDEEVLLEVLSKKLKNHDFEVVIARNGKEGMDCIEKDKPDLILLDMVMPKMTGYDVLESMKHRNIKIPVVIISNSGQPVDVEKALALGACDYIVKAEFGPDEIITKINKCLGPLDDAATPATAPQQESSADSDKERQETADKEQKTKKILILIAEDDMFLRELCARKLEKVGFDIDVAVDGIEAYEKITGTKPDLVLLDIIMPGMEGFEVLKRVRGHEDKSIADIPIIILSNLGQEGDTMKGIELGANEYLIKANYTMDEIVDKIREYIK